MSTLAGTGAPPLIAVKGLVKRYPGALALDHAEGAIGGVREAIAPSLPRRIRINDGAEVLRTAIKKATKDYGKTVHGRRLAEFVDVDRYFETTASARRRRGSTGSTRKRQGNPSTPTRLATPAAIFAHLPRPPDGST